MDCRMRGIPVLHFLLQFAQIHGHWAGDAIQSYHPSAALFSFCLQPFPASESFPMSQLFAIGGPSIGVSTSASVLPMTIQDWFPLGWTGLISLQSILIHRSNQGSEETEEEWTLMSSRDREKLLPGHMYLLLWSLKHCCLSTWVLLALETLINEA